MLFETPEIDTQELGVIDQIEELRRSLRLSLSEPRRWTGSLRRLSFARNVRGSNSIEGFTADLDDAAAVIDGEEPLDASTETRRAITGYRDAMTYVRTLSEEGQVDLNPQLIKSLHFMMTNCDLRARPGRWRSGPVFVYDDESETVVHEGADVDHIEALMNELSTQLNVSDEHVLARAAMAHLNLVMIHPFRDGNGRMARCLQGLVLARSGQLSPVFMSIEEYLGRNTPAYYDVLARVGGGGWNPQRDARPWLRFVLTAHLRQARTVRQRIRDSERMWDGLTRLVGAADERTLFVLFDAAAGLRVRRATYVRSVEQAGESISEQSATRDLKQMCDAGLLVPRGEKRGRHYVAGQPLIDLRRDVAARRDPRDDADPFA